MSKQKKKYTEKACKLKFNLSQVSQKWLKRQKDDLLEDSEPCHQQLQDPESEL